MDRQLGRPVWARRHAARLLVAAAAALALVPAATPASAVDGPGPATQSGSAALLASGAGWTVRPGPGGLVVEVRTEEVLRVRAAAPLIVADGRVIGVARITSPHTAEVVTRDATVLEAGSVELRWSSDRADAASSKRLPTPSRADLQRPDAPELGTDPRARGPYAVSVAAYDLGDTAMELDALNGRRVEARGVVFAPAAGTDAPAGRLPVLVFLHGMHAWCHGEQQGQTPEDAWPCPAGQEPVPSYRGYDAYASVLASHGYAVVSVSADGVNAFSDRTDLGNRARGEAVLRTLDLLRDWSRGDGGPLGEAVAGRLDLDRVGLMGHSRGGEGVVRAALLNSERQNPYGIRAVLPLAPTDFQRQVLPDVAMSVLLPTCDGDVSTLEGQHYFDDTRYVAGGRDQAPRSVVVVHGANHNFFNTEWTPGPGRPTGGDDWGGDPDDPDCGPEGPARLTADEQIDVGTAVVAGFFRAYIGRERALLPLFDGSGARPAGLPADLDVQAQQPARSRVDLARLDWRLAPTTPTGGMSAELCNGTTDSGEDPPGAAPACSTELSPWQAPQWVPAYLVPGARTSRVAHLRWDGDGALLVPAARDARAYDALTFRAAPDPAYGPSSDLVVRVTDASGAYADVRVSTVSPALTLTPGMGGRVLLRQVHIPLRSLPGVDLSALQSVELRGVGTGGAYVADIALARPGLGRSHPTRLPHASLEDLRVVEGDGPVRRDVTVTLDRKAKTDVRLHLRALPPDLEMPHGRVPVPLERELTIPAGSRSVSASIRLPGDKLDNEDERPILMVIALRRGAVPGDDLVEGALIDDDPSPSVSIGDASVVEGSAFLNVPLTLSEPSGRFLEVILRADDGTAVLRDDFGVFEGSDEEPSRFWYGYLSPGETEGSVRIPITDDRVAEPVETFGVTIAEATGAVVGTPSTVVATITDDD